MMQYYSHHVHLCDGSIGDSILKIKDYISKAKERNLDALTITDHGSLTAMYEFYHQCKKHKIKSIIGCEIYETKDRLDKDKKSETSKRYHHLVLLAKNNRGMENLLKISNDAQINGFYYKPRTDISVLKKYGKNIIAFSGCAAGKIPQLIIANDFEGAIAAIKEYKKIFDAFYLELQPGDFEEQHIINNALVELAAHTKTPLVVTNDVHYLEEEDYPIHDAHVKISRKMKLEDDMIYPDSCYWFMDYDAIISAFKSTIDLNILKEAIINTVEIAKLCNVELSETIHMPKFATPNNESEEYLLSKMCFDRFEEVKHTLSDPSTYMSRLLFELETINDQGFAGYFLIVHDFIRYARSQNIAVGPGRGSVGGALVAYLLNISLADPIKYNLMFERFLSPHRKSIPDIDIDFDSERRKEVLDYAVDTYGQNNCALVSTLQIRKARSAIRDTGRILGLDLEIVDRAAKLIPQVYYGDDGEKSTDLDISESLLVVPELQELSDEMPELFEIADKLSNLPAATSIHAAGILISPVDLSTRIPLIRSNNDNLNATSLNLSNAETAGFLKFDFLSLASLNVYEKTQADVNYYFDYFINDFDDEKVWGLIGSKYTTGLFQISSQTYKTRMPRLKPKNVLELAACLALLRGPCISSGADKKYMEILEGKQNIDPIHPLYYEATKDTRGILIYQEQLMSIAVNFGFSLEDGYKLVKYCSKKKIVELQAFEERFMAAAEQKNVSHDAAVRIWKTILDSGLYAFNRAHAVTYAILSYVSGYLKTYYPKEFLTNLLTNAYNRNKKEEILEALQDCRRMGFKFLPLDVNKSKWEFIIEDDMIRIGFCAVKTFGEKATQEVISKRPYRSFEDFMERIEKSKCNKKSMVAGIFAGLFDSFENDRETVYRLFMAERKEEPEGIIKLQTKEEFRPKDDIVTFEKILFGGEYLSDPANQLESFNFGTIKNNKLFTAEAYIKDIKRIKDRNNRPMAFLILATGDGHIDCTVFTQALEKYKKLIKKGRFCQLKAKKDSDYSCVLQEIC